MKKYVVRKNLKIDDEININNEYLMTFSQNQYENYPLCIPPI